MSEYLHVTNGDIVASMLDATTLPGAALSWADALHAGPLAFDPARSRPLRAAFLASSGWGGADAIEAELVARDERLARALGEGRSVVLWFEHDLFDQLLLLQLLAALGNARPGQVELVQAVTYLGSLETSELEALWPTREPVSHESLEEGGAVWRTLCNGDLDAAQELDSGALPHVGAALRRLREERARPSRTQRQLLQALAAGPRTAGDAYLESQAREEAVFLGDAWAFAELAELADEGLVEPAGDAPLPDAPPRGGTNGFASTLVTLTPTGRGLV